MQQVGEQARAKDVLGSKIGQRGTEAFTISLAARTVLRRLVADLRKTGGHGGAGNVERVDVLFEREVPLLFRREGDKGGIGIPDGLEVGDDTHDAVGIERSEEHTSELQ